MRRVYPLTIARACRPAAWLTACLQHPHFCTLRASVYPTLLHRPIYSYIYLHASEYLTVGSQDRAYIHIYIHAYTCIHGHGEACRQAGHPILFLGLDRSVRIAWIGESLPADYRYNRLYYDYASRQARPREGQKQAAKSRSTGPARTEEEEGGSSWHRPGVHARWCRPGPCCGRHCPLWTDCRFGRPPGGEQETMRASALQGIEEWPSPLLSASFYIQETLISPGPPCWSARLHSRAPAWVSTVLFCK